MPTIPHAPEQESDDPIRRMRRRRKPWKVEQGVWGVSSNKPDWRTSIGSTMRICSLPFFFQYLTTICVYILIINMLQQPINGVRIWNQVSTCYTADKKLNINWRNGMGSRWRSLPFRTRCGICYPPRNGRKTKTKTKKEMTLMLDGLLWRKSPNEINWKKERNLLWVFNQIPSLQEWNHFF